MTFPIFEAFWELSPVKFVNFNACLEPDGTFGVPHDVDVEGSPGGVAQPREQRLQDLEEGPFVGVPVHHDVEDSAANNLKITKARFDLCT